MESLVAHHGHHHHHGHEVHPLDDCCGGWFHPQHNCHYVYVGDKRGRYEELHRGHFYYVGPNKGCYEKEQLPIDHTGRYVCLCLCVLLTMATVIVVITQLLKDPPFDCQAGLANWKAGWSFMKKEWCCENEELGCPDWAGIVTTPGPEILTTPRPTEPHWLQTWMPDMTVGCKFILMVVMATMIGCCCGAFSLYMLVRYFLPPKSSPTELELMAELNQLLNRAGALKGELAVSLMWDTTDDLDLHLTLPDHQGEISATHKEVSGGRLDIDANIHGHKGTKPIENIYWPPFDPHNPTETPPIGEYVIWVKVADKHDHHRDANVTVVLTMSGQREIFHHRVVPGCKELKICTFHYHGPPQLLKRMQMDSHLHHDREPDRHVRHDRGFR